MLSIVPSSICGSVFALVVAAALCGAVFGPGAEAQGEAPEPGGVSRNLPATVDLRPRIEKWGLERRRQGDRGTCSVFTVTGALEYAVAVKQGKGTRLSVEYLNWAGHKAVGRRQDGGFFSDLWKGFEKYGICKKTNSPTNPTSTRTSSLGPAPRKAHGGFRRFT